MASPFKAFDSQYSAHTDLSIHPVTGVVTITVAFHPNNRGGYNCKIWELDPPYTGQPRVVGNWVQGAENVSVGPFGHGASLALPTGGVLTCVPVAGDTADVRPSLMIDSSLGSPYPLGGGGVYLFDQPKTSPAWEGRVMPANVGELVDIPATFGAPPASAYLLRFVAQSGTPDVRVRAGTQAAPYFLTMNLTVATMQQHIQGWAPGPQVWVSTANGAAQVWLQVLGMG